MRIVAVVGTVLLLGGLTVDTVSQPGGNRFRPMVCLVMLALIALGFRHRSSLATAFGLVGLAMAWALSQETESATGAVLVGAVLTVVAVTLSRLAEAPVRTPAAAQVRSAARLMLVIAGASAMGLAALQFVDRPPAGRLIMLLGVVAVMGTLGMLYFLGGDEGQTSPS